VKNILVLTFWSFEDALIQTYTLPYVKIISTKLPKGSKVYMMTLEQDHKQIYSIKNQQMIKELEELNIIILPKKYFSFGLRAIFQNIKNLFSLSHTVVFKNISTIHSWSCTAGVFGYFLAKIWRKALVIDSFEPHAESMVENGTWEEKSISYQILFLFEKLVTKISKHIIGTTEGMKFYAKEKYGINIESFYVKPACVNVEQFDFAKPKK
jgi:hypothetical protein